MWFKNVRTAEACETVDSQGWTIEAATSGDPLAQFLHARREKTAEMGLVWLERSARAGFTRAANEYGQRLVEGSGGAVKNVKEGRAWLEISARAGEPEGLYNLGLLEVTSPGGDEATAVSLFRQAAERGLSLGAANMGVAYLNGKGVAKDARAAQEWFERAGDTRSLLLAARLAKSHGDEAAVERILMRAAKGGSKEASQLLFEMKKKKPDVSSLREL